MTALDIHKRIPAKADKLVLLLLLWTTGLFAQKHKKDTLTPIRDFVEVSTGYKQSPLYLDMEMRNSCNFITDEDDTAMVRAEFYIQSQQAYVRFGEFEQIVNDSMALLVSNKAQAMVLFTDAALIVKQMRAMMGQPVHDSSVRNLAFRYSGTNTKIDKNTSATELQSRATIYGTSFPKEIIRMEYETQTRLPKLVTTTKRSMVPLDSAQYNEFKKEPALAGSLFAMEGHYFLMKEQISSYQYRQILREATVKIPVTIADRITRGEEGEYIPVKPYENYVITKND